MPAPNLYGYYALWDKTVEQKHSDFGEEAISKTMEIALSSQLEQAEALNVQIEADPFDLMGGELKAADIDGRGLVVQDSLRTEQLQLKTNGIAIDPGKAAFGEIKLTRPTQATTVITLTAADIEQAFNSDFVRQKIAAVAVELNGQTTHISAKQIEFELPGNQKMAFRADVAIAETQEPQQIEFKAVPKIGPQGNQIILTDVQVTSQNSFQELTDRLLEAASELLDLRNFALEGMEMQLQQIDVRKGVMVLYAAARITQFPNG